jgi:hypothetical protein
LDETFLSPEELTILKFACKIAKEAHRATDMEVNKIRQLGMTDEDLMDIIGSVALAVSNYIWCDTMDIKVPELEALILEEMYQP